MSLFAHGNLRALAGFLLLASTAATAEADTVTISSEPFSTPSEPGKTRFSRVDGAELGLYRPLEFSMRDIWPPFWNGRGVSSGDYDRDGDPDVLLASSDRGFHLFENTGNLRFEERLTDKGGFAGFPGFLAAFVDLNGDGWVDIFLSGYQAGMWVLWNEEGTFDLDAMEPVENRDDAIMVKAVAFGDVDRDGDLDAAIGNWATGWYRTIPGPEGTNRIILNDGTLSGRDYRELDALPGETLSMLLSDFDLDGDLDLFEANDFEVPDAYYRGDGTGAFRRIGAGEGTIPRTTTSTMSFKTADFDNDAVPEIYVSQVAGRAEGMQDRMTFRPLQLYCMDVVDQRDRAQCQANMDLRAWYRMGGHQVPVSEAFNCRNGPARFEAECKAMLIKDVAIQTRNADYCGFIDEAMARARLQCEAHFRPQGTLEPEVVKDYAQQILGKNVYLVRNADGTYEDRADASGISVGGWSWDVKTEDFDFDGLLDLYITNGHWIVQNVSPSNMFFRNAGDGTFEEATAQAGLEEFMIYPAVTMFDPDNDGDLDFVGQAVNGPVIAFINNSQEPGRIGFRLEDEVGNRLGIGSQLTLRLDDGSIRFREIVSGGGFLSFDEPRAYFGMGGADRVEEVTVRWSTGETTTHAGPFERGALHTIRRTAG